MANLTYVEAIDVAISTLAKATEPNDIVDESNDTVIEKLKALKEQLAKRGSKGGLTKTQKLNEEIKTIILEILAEAEEFLPMADIMADERLTDLTENDEPVKVSPQKMGALLGQLIKADKAQRHVHKKRTLYAVKGVEFVAPDAEPADDEAD